MKTKRLQPRRPKPSQPRRVDFFGPAYLAQYRAELSGDRTAREIEFLRKQLGLKRGMSVLDLGCGSGRHAIELAKLGCQVTGLDQNRFLLEEAARAVKEAGVPVELVRQDMRRMTFRGSFDAIVSLYTSFGYFSDEADHLRVITLVARSLKPGGRFFIDMASRDHLIRHFTPRDFRLHPDGSITLHERSFDPARSVKRNRQIHIAPDGTRETTSIEVRLFSPHELIGLCKAAGLELVSFWGDVDEPYTVDSHGVMLVARKPRSSARR